MASVSRRRLAQYVAAHVRSGTPSKRLIQEVAAYLIEHRQTNQADLYLADIEQELAKGGLLVADITTARALDAASRKLVEDYVLKSEKASEVTLREHIDPSLIGGIVIRVNGRELNAAVSAQIRQLKTA